MCTAVPSGLLIRTGVDWFECAGDDVSPGTRSNDGKVQRGRGSETAPFPVFFASEREKHANSFLSLLNIGAVNEFFAISPSGKELCGRVLRLQHSIARK